MDGPAWGQMFEHLVLSCESWQMKPVSWCGWLPVAPGMRPKQKQAGANLVHLGGGDGGGLGGGDGGGDGGGFGGGDGGGSGGGDGGGLWSSASKMSVKVGTAVKVAQ